VFIVGTADGYKMKEDVHITNHEERNQAVCSRCARTVSVPSNFILGVCGFCNEGKLIVKKKEI